MFLVAIENSGGAKSADLFAEMNLRYRSFQSDLGTKPPFHRVQ